MSEEKVMNTYQDRRYNKHWIYILNYEDSYRILNFDTNGVDKYNKY